MNRQIRVAVCSLVAPIGRAPIPRDQRLEEAKLLLRRAADQGAQWACLPEWFGTWMTVGNPQGPEVQKGFHAAPPEVIQNFLTQCAREFHLHLICSYITQRDGKYYNSAVLIANDGSVAGEYQKVHLPEEEAKWTEQGSDYPVFNLDGVKVGLQLCYDLNYPEGCRILMLRGADLIFWPHIWRNTTPVCEYLVCTRAVENMVFICGSSYVSNDPDLPVSRQPHPGLTAIIGWDGQILARPTGAPSVAVAELDLDQPRSWQDSCQAMLVEHRRPDTYGPLIDQTKMPSLGGRSTYFKTFNNK